MYILKKMHKKEIMAEDGKGYLKVYFSWMNKTLRNLISILQQNIYTLAGVSAFERYYSSFNTLIMRTLIEFG